MLLQSPIVEHMNNGLVKSNKMLMEKLLFEHVYGPNFVNCFPMFIGTMDMNLPVAG